MTDDEKYLFDLTGFLVIENVLTPEEVERVLGELGGAMRLVGLLLYGAGLRLMEAGVASGRGPQVRAAR